MPLGCSFVQSYASVLRIAAFQRNKMHLNNVPDYAAWLPLCVL